MLSEDLKPNVTVYGSIFPEPVQVIITTPLGNSVKLTGKGLRSNKVYDSILSPEQIAQLEASPEREPFDGDATKFRLGVEAMRLGLAYEHDPYFSLSIARVDPLPHQLEAVYDYPRNTASFKSAPHKESGLAVIVRETLDRPYREPFALQNGNRMPLSLSFSNRLATKR